MGKYMNSQDIYEQYVDAAAALIMDQYATAMQENIAASATEHIEISENLNNRCHKIMKQRLAKRQRKYTIKRCFHLARTVAMIVLMCFGVVGILFTTVEAVRIPIINFFIEQNDGYLEISGADASHSENTQNAEIGTEKTDLFASVLPKGYQLIVRDISNAGNTFAVYGNEDGEHITIAIEPFHGILHVDTEGATYVEKTTVLSYEAVITENDGCQITWLNTDANLLYLIDATDLSQVEIKNLAENIEKIS